LGRTEAQRTKEREIGDPLTEPNWGKENQKKPGGLTVNVNLREEVEKISKKSGVKDRTRTPKKRLCGKALQNHGAKSPYER